MSALKSRPTNLSVILVAGFAAGILDGIAAIVNYLINSPGKNPAAIFKFIASGIMGKQAFAGSNQMIILGVALHLFIALLFAAFFFLLYKRIKWIADHTILSGLAYGIFVWLVMNKLVVPLSKTPALNTDTFKMFISIMILIFFVGLPIALVTRIMMKKRIIGS